MPAQAANVVSLLVTAVANTAANRRLTFGISGRSGSARHQFKGLIAFGIGLALTSGALAALRARPAGRLAEVSVLIAANLVATVHEVPAVPALGLRQGTAASASARIRRSSQHRRPDPAIGTS